MKLCVIWTNIIFQTTIYNQKHLNLYHCKKETQKMKLLKIRPFFSYSVSGRISGKPDINKTFLLLFEDLRCFNYLSNCVEQQTYIEISGIRPDIRYPAPTGYPAGNPVFKMARYRVGRISGKTAIRSIPST